MSATTKKTVVARAPTPWVEQYRPQTIDEIAGHHDVLRMLRNVIHSKTAAMPHIFLYGPPGTGKTSTILACARLMYGPSIMRMMVLHLNASDNRDISVMHKRIIQFASTANLFCPSHMRKLIILDEADNMTEDVQTVLQDIIMRYNTCFCLIGNYQYALNPALQSRLVRIMFAPLAEADVCSIAQRVVLAERRRERNDDTLLLSADEQRSIVDLTKLVYHHMTGGDLRMVLNVLQAVHIREARIDIESVERMFHVSTMKNHMITCLRLMKLSDFAPLLLHVRTVLKECTLNFNRFMQQLLPYVWAEATDTTKLINLVDELAEIEYNASHSVYNDVQLFCSMVALASAMQQQQPVANAGAAVAAGANATIIEA